MRAGCHRITTAIQPDLLKCFNVSPSDTQRVTDGAQEDMEMRGEKFVARDQVRLLNKSSDGESGLAR